MINRTSRKGIIKLIILIIAAILLLSYFGINLRQLVDSDVTQSNFDYIWSWVIKGWAWGLEIWRTFISGPFFQILSQYQ